MKTLGLDLSCSTCGIAISENNQILLATFADISCAKSYEEKADIIMNVIGNSVFDRIVIEESLFGFAQGGTSQQVIIKLVKNKAVIGYILENHYKIKIESIHAQTARKKALGAARVKGVKAKEFVKSELEKQHDLTRWTVLNKRGNPDKRMEDVRDAIVLSLGA